MTRPDAALAAINAVLDLHRGGHLCADNSVSQPRWFNERAGAKQPCPTHRWLTDALTQVEHLHAQVHEAAHTPETVDAVAAAMLSTPLTELDPEQQEGWRHLARLAVEALAYQLDRDPEQEARVLAAQARLAPPAFPAGSTIYAVDQQGATFVTTSEAAQLAVARDEADRGAVELVTFTCRAPRDLTADEAADYACANGADVAVSHG